MFINKFNYFFRIKINFYKLILSSFLLFYPSISFLTITVSKKTHPKSYKFFNKLKKFNLFLHNWRKTFLNLFIVISLYLLFITPDLIDLFLNNPLFMIISITMLNIIFIFLIPFEFKNLLRHITFFSVSLNYFISLTLWFFFDRNTPKFQFLINLGKLHFLNTDIIFGLDGISLFFIILTTIISPLLILISWYINTNVKFLMLSIILSTLFTLLTFISLDLFLFFIVFECLLIPLFISILYWGSSERKIKASIMLFLYTLLSSFVFIIAIFTIYLEIGSTNFFAILSYSVEGFSIEKQKFLWLLLFIAFAVKVPLYPLHTWLPEAHVEAPTFGSVILASLLLKTGGYGLFRYVIPIFPEANIYYTPLVYCLALMGVLYAALSALRQLDIKRIVAYLSISHMNFCVLGQFSENLEGILGSLLLMIAHGIIAAGFFISIGILYKRYHTRLLMYFGGIARIMPVFSLFLFILTLGNMNMPGTSNFVGELLILIGVGHKSLIITLFAAVGSAIGALCTIWLWSKIMFGELKIHHFIKFSDLSRKEFFSLFPLILINFFIGLLTNEFIDTMYCSAYFLNTFLVV